MTDFNNNLIKYLNKQRELNPTSFHFNGTPIVRFILTKGEIFIVTNLAHCPVYSTGYTLLDEEGVLVQDDNLPNDLKELMRKHLTNYTSGKLVYPLCNLCKTKPKYWEGDDRLCAFQGGSFSADNWNCATLGELRKLILEHFDSKNRLGLDIVFRYDEERWVVINLEGADMVEYDYESDDPIPEDPTCLYMGWYKSRGRLSQLLLMFNDQPPREPTEEEVLKIIKYIKEYK